MLSHLYANHGNEKLHTYINLGECYNFYNTAVSYRKEAYLLVFVGNYASPSPPQRSISIFPPLWCLFNNHDFYIGAHLIVQLRSIVSVTNLSKYSLI